MHPHTNKDQLLFFFLKTQRIQSMLAVLLALPVFSSTIYIIAAFLIKVHEYKLKV